MRKILLSILFIIFLCSNVHAGNVFIPQLITGTSTEVLAGVTSEIVGNANDGKVYALREAHIILGASDSCTISFGIDSCEGTSYDVSSFKNFVFSSTKTYVKTWGDEAFTFGFKKGDASTRDILTIDSTDVSESVTIKLYWEPIP